MPGPLLGPLLGPLGLPQLLELLPLGLLLGPLES